MNNTENLKSTVSSLDDEALRLKVEAVISALGISSNAVGRKLNDMSFVRNTVMNMSEEDLYNIISVLGAQNAQDILESLKGK